MIYDTLAAIADYNDRNTDFRRNRFDASPGVLDQVATIATKFAAGSLPLSVGNITVRGQTKTDTTLLTAVYFADGLIHRTPMAQVQAHVEPYT